MWWARRRSAPCTAWLGRRRVALWDAAGETAKAHETDSVDEGMAWLRAEVTRATLRRGISLRLDGDLCQLDAVDAWKGVGDPVAAEAAMNAAGGEALGQAGEVLRLARWPQGNQRWLAVRVGAGVLDQAEATFGRQLVSVKPWWWTLVPRKAAAVGFHDGRLLTSVAMDEAGELNSVQSIAQVSDDAGAVRWFRRLGAPSGQPNRGFILRWGSVPPNAASPATTEEPHMQWVERVELD